jgi:hypothetical protein
VADCDILRNFSLTVAGRMQKQRLIRSVANRTFFEKFPEEFPVQGIWSTLIVPSSACYYGGLARQHPDFRSANPINPPKCWQKFGQSSTVSVINRTAVLKRAVFARSSSLRGGLRGFALRPALTALARGAPLGSGRDAGMAALWPNKGVGLKSDRRAMYPEPPCYTARELLNQNSVVMC